MAHAWLWAGLGVLVLGAIAVDLGVHRHQHRALTLRAAIGWSAAFIALALGYGAVEWWRRGSGAAAEFYTAWLLEKSLSFDNLMVFLLIFRRLGVAEGERHRVLTWGILGALVLRGLIIVGGVHLLRYWRPVTYVFGAFLAYTGVRTLMGGRDDEAKAPRWLDALRRRLPLPPLVLAVVVIELADVLFAVDSIPAVLGVTEDVQIVFSSNVLAVLGLRALYFVVERLVARLAWLHVGIGVILVLVGAKMCLGRVVHVPAWLSLSVTLAVLGATVAASLLTRRRRATGRAPLPPDGHGAPGARASWRAR